MQKLSTAEFRDIAAHALERMTRDMTGAFQLIEDHKQRAVLALDLAEVFVTIAAEVTCSAYYADNGTQLERRMAVYSIIKRIMAREGIQFQEVER